MKKQKLSITNPEDHPYWNSWEGRIVIPKVRSDGMIIHSQQSKEHQEVLKEMGITPDKDIFHEDTLIYLREREKNRKVAEALRGIIAPKNTQNTLDMVGVTAVYGARTRRRTQQKTIEKVPKMLQTTWELGLEFGAVGAAQGGFAGARAGFMAGAATGIALSAAEVLITLGEVIGIQRPKGIGLEWRPDWKKKKDDKKMKSNIPDAN